MFIDENKLQLFDQILDANKLKAYFLRVGYSGEVAPNLECLKQLQYLHPQAIAFENLNPFLGLSLDLKFSSIFDKLVSEGRGGYCFEHNLLFGQVLKTIGFKVKGLSARVFWEVPEGEVKPRDHMVLMVQVSGRNYIADVGFGGASFTGPLELYYTEEQQTPHEPYRITENGGFYYLEIKINGEWRLMYRFGLEEQLMPDYEVVSWYLCSFPNSMFVNELMLARCMPWGRYALHNNKFTTHRLDGNSEKQTFVTANEIKAALEDKFLIQLPENVGLLERLKDLVNKD